MSKHRKKFSVFHYVIKLRKNNCNLFNFLHLDKIVINDLELLWLLQMGYNPKISININFDFLVIIYVHLKS